ncbi:S-layer homology domain-containing protein [Ureibacillus thermosphaericus]|uniref:S-layer homology domain-containing protein n=1 Tax=Ureibacillus thermosphaericus TaxID=51173 RepID=UPI0002E20C28|nr:S-layer homology domain-containing protein [Ureibacillus thermosphaericus]
MKLCKKKSFIAASALALALTVPTVFNPMVNEVNAETLQQELRTPVYTVAAVKTFKDVPTTHTYFEIINEMVNKGIITGYEDGTFKPNQMISRQHAAVLVSRATDLKPTVPYQQYRDIPPTHVYHDQIKELQMAGIFNVDSRGFFNPKQNMTRGEMAKALAIAFELDIPEKVAKRTFKDISELHQYAPYIEALYKSGVTTGYEDGTFRAEEPLSRTHYAVFMYRAMNNIGLPNEEEEVKEDDSDLIMLNTSDEIAEKLISIYKENEDVFTERKPFNVNSFKNHPISLKIYEEGLDELRSLGLKIQPTSSYLYSSQIEVTKEGYKNPSRRLTNKMLYFNGRGEDMGKINFDYREKEAEQLAQAWLKIAYPEHFVEILSPMITQKVAEARPNVNNVGFSNIELIYINGYEIQIGVNQAKEEFILHVREPQYKCLEFDGLRCKKHDFVNPLW